MEDTVHKYLPAIVGRTGLLISGFLKGGSGLERGWFTLELVAGVTTLSRAYFARPRGHDVTEL